MHWQFNSFGLLFLVITAIAVIVNVQAHRRSFPGNGFFIIFMASAAVWAFTGALEWFVAFPKEKAFWSEVSYFGIVNAAPSWFCFTLAYCGLKRVLTKRTIVLLWIIPAVTLLIALTNGWHGWNWPSYSMVHNPLGNYMYYEHGPSFWVLTVFSYILNVASSILLLRQSGKLFRLYQTQSLILFLAAVIPWIGNILYNTRTVSIIDLTPASFTFTGVLIWWNMKRFHLFDVAPVARETLFTNIQEMVVVLDSLGRIVDMNASAQSHFAMKSIPIGTAAETVLSSWPQLRTFISSTSMNHSELPCTTVEKDEQWFSVTKTELLDSHSSPSGTMIICRNITDEKKRALEREHLITELQEALGNVKTLSGLLPICASCKKIRNDEGYWQQVESYIGEHTGATFSHSLCPECMKSIYPNIKQQIS